MDGRGKPWIRGVATLGLLGALTAGLVASPVGAGSKFATKKFVKKQITKLGNQTAATEGVYSSFKQGPVDIVSVGAFPALPDAPSVIPIASLSVPPGKYGINAKMTLGVGSMTHCRLTAGADVDDARSFGFTNTIPLAVTHEFAEPGIVSLACADGNTPGNTDDKAYFIKITAIRTQSLTNTPSP